jgi:beta-glucosidase
MSPILTAVIESLHLGDSNGKSEKLNGHADGHSSHNGHSNGTGHLEHVLAALSLPEKVFLLSGSSFTTTGGVPSHGLHKVAVSDALTDVRGSQIFNAPATAIFPNSTALAATFDTELLQQVGVELANEMKLKSVECLLAPNLNLHRDPRAGRNQETFGEDPFLAGACGTAIVNGK